VGKKVSRRINTIFLNNNDLTINAAGGLKIRLKGGTSTSIVIFGSSQLAGDNRSLLKLQQSMDTSQDLVLQESL
jgi:hypothetical protein